MSIQDSTSAAEPARSREAFVRLGFRWDAADAYLFDIDGTLINSRDAVHYNAFHAALRGVFGVEMKIDNVPVHGNTDPGILRAVLRREGREDHEIDALMPQMAREMCAHAQKHSEQMRPELCPSIDELVSTLHARGKLIGAASGNLETIGWLKLEKAGLRPLFSFGSFSFPREQRADIFRHGVNTVRQMLNDSAVIYVAGDTPADIAAAKAVGLPVIALATGIFSFRELLSLGPDACFGCVTDMLHLE